MDNAVSVNRLKTWSRCRKKYFLDYVNKLHWPTDPANFRLGQDVHKLLDYHARGLDCAHLLEYAQADVKQAWDLLMAEPITFLSVLGSEWGFQVPLAGHWLVGRVDRIAQDRDNIRVIDWKTGTAVPKTPETDWQTVVYLYAVYEARRELGFPDVSPEKLSFVYVEVKDRIRLIEVPYSEKQHAAHRELLTSAIQDMVAETAFKLPEACPDRYCPYAQVCGIQEAFALTPG